MSLPTVLAGELGVKYSYIAATHVAIVDVEDVDLSRRLDLLHSGSVPAAKKEKSRDEHDEVEGVKIDGKNNSKRRQVSHDVLISLEKK